MPVDDLMQGRRQNNVPLRRWMRGYMYEWRMYPQFPALYSTKQNTGQTTYEYELRPVGKKI